MFVGTRSTEDNNYVYEYNQVSNEWRITPQSNTITKGFPKLQQLQMASKILLIYMV